MQASVSSSPTFPRTLHFGFRPDGLDKTEAMSGLPHGLLLVALGASENM